MATPPLPGGRSFQYKDMKMLRFPAQIKDHLLLWLFATPIPRRPDYQLPPFQFNWKHTTQEGEAGVLVTITGMTLEGFVPFKDHKSFQRRLTKELRTLASIWYTKLDAEEAFLTIQHLQQPR